MNQTPLANAKADWFRKFEGAVLNKEVAFGSPTVRHLYKRSFDQLGRNCFFISVFGRILLGESQMAEAEAAIYSRIQDVHTYFEHKIVTFNALLTTSGIEDAAQFNKLENVEASIVAPAQGRFLRVLALSDEYLRMVNTLWLEGVIPDRDKSKAELDLKHRIRGIATTTRKSRLYLQAKVNEANERERNAANNSAATPAVPGTTDEVIPEVSTEQVASNENSSVEATVPEVAEAAAA